MIIIGLVVGAVTLVLSIAWPTFGHAVLDAVDIVVIGWLGSYLLLAMDKKEFASMMRVMMLITAIWIIAEPLVGVVGSVRNFLLTH